MCVWGGGGGHAIALIMLVRRKRGGGQKPWTVINVGTRTNQRQTFVGICCFSPSQSVGAGQHNKTNTPRTTTTEKQQPTDTEHLVVHEQIDRLLITESWLGCRGDEAKCGHDELGNSMAPCPPSAT